MAGSRLLIAPTLRRMTDADIAAIIALEESVYPQPWSERVFRDELSLQNRSYLVADQEGTIVGYGGLLVDESDAHITTVAVDPEARRHQLGTRLMLALVDEALAAGAQYLTLEVRVSNEGARRLYQRFGFSPVGVRKNYYLTEDAVVMWAIDIGSEDYQQRINAIRKDLEQSM